MNALAETTTPILPTIKTTSTAIIATTSSVVEEINIRLAGGLFPSEGRLEVQIDDVYGAVCLDGFDRKIVEVVCTQLGYG